MRAAIACAWTIPSSISLSRLQQTGLAHAALRLESLTPAERASGDDLDRFHIANGHTLQVHRLPGANSFCIVEVCDESNLLGEKTACPADQEDKYGQGQ